MKQMRPDKKEQITSIAKLVRWPNLAIVFLTQYVAYVFVLKSRHSEVIAYWPPPSFFMLSLGTILVAAAGYVINDYYDIKIDLVNKPYRIVIGRIISRRQAIFLHSILNFVAIAIGFFLSWRVALFFAFCAFLLWLYSNILKRTPLLGNIIISVLTAAVVWVVGLYFHQNDRLIYVYSIFAFCISLLREIIKDMEDTKGDAIYGCKTLPIVLGIRNAKIVVILFLFAFIILLLKQAQMVENEREAAMYYLIVLPLLYLGYRILLADKQKDYTDMSAFCKWLMLVGVISLGLA